MFDANSIVELGLPPVPPSSAKLLLMLFEALRNAHSTVNKEEGLRVDKHSDRQTLHAKRSTAFVESLASEIEDHYRKSKNVCVFRKRKSSERFRLGSAARGELLFDILACVMGSCQAPVNQAAGKLGYVKESLLQVESELANNTAETLVDASKLVCGSASLSLFVGPLSPKEKPGHPYLQVLKQVAPHIHGQFLCAFIPHPRDWEASGALKVSLFLWARDKADWDEFSPSDTE